MAVFSFAPYSLLNMASRSCAAPLEFRRKQMATTIGNPYNVCQMPLEVSCFCWTSDINNIPSLYMALITAVSFGAVTYSISINSLSLIHKFSKLDGMDSIPFPSTVITVLFHAIPPIVGKCPLIRLSKTAMSWSSLLLVTLAYICVVVMFV